jgi:hypothetical protein
MHKQLRQCKKNKKHIMASPTEPSPAPTESDDDNKPSLEDLWNDRVPSDRMEKYFPEIVEKKSAKTESPGISLSSNEPSRDTSKKEQHQAETHPTPTPMEKLEPSAVTDDPTQEKAESLPEGAFKPGRLDKGTLPPPKPIPRRPKRPLQPGWVARG